MNTMNTSSDHVEVSLSKIRSIFEKAAARIEAMKPGDKIPATKLADDLAKEIGMTGPALYPTLKFLIDGYPGRLVKRGAKGGIIFPLPTPAVNVQALTDSVTAILAKSNTNE